MKNYGIPIGMYSYRQMRRLKFIPINYKINFNGKIFEFITRGKKKPIFREVGRFKEVILKEQKTRHKKKTFKRDRESKNIFNSLY